MGPLERRLFWIVFAGLLPITLLSFATLLQNAESHKRRLIRQAEETTNAVIRAVDTEFFTTLAALDTLAASPRLARNDFTALHAEARALLQRRPNWANVIVSDASAQQLMNARLPVDQPLPAGIDKAGIEAAVRTGKPGVGDLIFSPVLDSHAIAVRIPIRDGEEVSHVLTAVIRPEAISGLLKRQRIPEGGVVTILDSRKIVVARSIDHEEWVAKAPSPTLLELLQKAPEGAWATTETPEGVDVFTIFRRSNETGWYAAMGIPKDVLNAPVTRSYMVLGGSILGSLLLGLLAAFVTGRSVTRPMRELEEAAAAVGRGELPRLPDTSLPEIRQAAQALAEAHIEREKLLQSEREARRAAENASRTKDEFLAMLGHELRNPLAAITTAAQILNREEHVPPNALREAKAIIMRQAQHLARLTDDLLDAGRVMMGRIELDRKAADLARIVEGAIATMRKTGQLSGHEVTLSLNPVLVNVDVTRMDQVVGNLLTNAVKYTPKGGSIRVSLKQEKQEAVLRIADSGLGLEPDLLPRVFDLFVQGTRTLERAQGGLGIGLTLVRRLTELHGGRVEVKSEGPGKGSEFIVRLPVMEAVEFEPEPLRQSDGSVRRKVVLVEDNEDVRASVRALLEMEGHEVHEAADGESGVVVILREQPDVAFIDIGLPVLDGYAVARSVKAKIQRRILLVAMTGYGSQEDRERGISAGFDAYLVKPVDPAQVRELLAREIVNEAKVTPLRAQSSSESAKSAGSAGT